MIHSDGRSWPPGRLAKLRHRIWDHLRRWSVRDVEIVDDQSRLVFRCANLVELTRCMSLFSKEQGTCEWIKNEVAPGEIFCDIGANIGIYTVLAALNTGETGKVYAFEPHSANFSRLLENIAANGLQDIVIPCNVALNDTEGFFPFNYISNVSGTANSQLATVRGAHETEYRPEVSELKYATSLDHLVDSGLLEVPHHVKIDVDGNEMLILKGMRRLLSGPQRPRSVQVEINKRYKEEIMPFMESCGYVMSERHFSRSGLKKLARGADPEDYTYNAIFSPKS